MNRRERRHAEAMERKRQAEADKLPPARADGRPEYYDISVGSFAACYNCLLQGLESRYRTGEAFMSNPANPPEGAPKGPMYTVCKHHLPDDAVIYNPRTNMCRNKAGDHTWEEAPREEVDYGDSDNKSSHNRAR